MIRKIAALFLFLAPASQAQASYACSIHTITKLGNLLKTGRYTVQLLGDDSPVDAATSAKTGIIVTNTAGKSCSLDGIAIVTAPDFLAGDHMLYVSLTSDSSNFYLIAINLTNCDLPWESKEHFEPPALVGAHGFGFGDGGRENLGANCLPAKPGA